MNNIHIFLDRVFNGNKQYSYIIQHKTKRSVEYVTSMPIYKTKEEAKIAAELYIEKYCEEKV